MDSPDCSPQAVERVADYFDRLSSKALDAQFIVPMVRGAESEIVAALLRALSSRLSEVERDAARYRWLRDDSNFAPPVAGYMTWPVHGHDHTDACPTYGADLDAAIDAALARGGKT